MPGMGQKFGMGKVALALPIFLLTGAAWVVTLGGLAAARHAGGESNGVYNLSFGWFVWAWEAFVLFMVLLHLIEAGASGLGMTTTGVTVLVGSALVLTIIETRDYNTFKNASGGNQSSTTKNGLITAFAGFLALSVCNTILLLVLGTDHGRAAHQMEVKKGSHSRQQPVGTTTDTVGTGNYARGTTEV